MKRMRIEHVALWTSNLERSKHFYETYFGATAGTKYTNTQRQFESYFLQFEGGARLELMQMPGVVAADGQLRGWAHIAIATGSQQAVDALTNRLEQAGYTVSSQPRTTGDGYYESVVLDPDGNPIEITT